MYRSLAESVSSLPWPILLLIVVVALWCGSWLFKKGVWFLFGFDQRGRAILSTAKSSEVRTGKIVESLAPLLDSFPVEVGKQGSSLVFIGQPVDYLYFDPDGSITVIEVKSADAKKSGLQRRIKAAIEEGRVSWAEVRIA